MSRYELLRVQNAITRLVLRARLVRVRGSLKLLMVAASEQLNGSDLRREGLT